MVARFPMQPVWKCIGLVTVLLSCCSVTLSSTCYPAIAFFETSLSIHFVNTPNSTFPIVCEPSVAGRFELRNVTWKFNNKTILPSENVVPGSQFTKKLIYRRFDDAVHAGWYQCVLNYKQGILMSPSFLVALESMSQPRLLVLHGASHLDANRTLLIVLQCQVDHVWPSTVPLSIRWYRDGKPLDFHWNQEPGGPIEEFPCDGQDVPQLQRTRFKTPAVSRCLFLWGFRVDVDDANFTCAAIGRQRLNSSTVRLDASTKVDRVFPAATQPLVTEKMSVRQGSHGVHVALPCNRAGVVAVGETKWGVAEDPEDPHSPFLEVQSAVDNSVTAERRGHLLYLMTDRLRLGRTYNITCKRVRPLQVVKEVLLTVYPQYWHIARCSTSPIMQPQGSSLLLTCAPHAGITSQACSERMSPGLPHYEVHWFLNGRRVISGQAGMNVSGHSLRVANLRSGLHTGIVQCRVVSGLGDERWENFIVMVRSPAQPVWRSVSVVNITNGSATIMVRLGARPPLCGKLACSVSESGLLPSSRIQSIYSPVVNFSVIVAFEHLQPFRSYVGECRFYGDSMLGSKPKSFPSSIGPKFFFKTREARPMSQPDFEILEEQPGGLLLRWHPLDASHAMGRISRHRLLWRLATGTDAFNVSKDLPGNATQFTLRGLLGNALYDVAVESGTQVGYPDFEQIGRIRVTLRAHTLAVHPRSFVPRLPIIKSFSGSLLFPEGQGSVNLSVQWRVNANFSVVVHQWNVTVYFSMATRTRTLLLPPTAQGVTLMPPPGLTGHNAKALVWLEALDHRRRVLDDEVKALRLVPTSFHTFDPGAPSSRIWPPQNVSILCTPEDSSLVVRWRHSELGRNSLCVTARTGLGIGKHACFVRIRLVPLPITKFRRRLYVNLSPYTNDTAVEAGRLKLTGLEPNTRYAVSVAFSRPPLVSAFAGPVRNPSCRVHAPRMPVPQVSLRRLDEQRVRVRLLATDAMERVRYVAIRFYNAELHPLANLSPLFAEPKTVIDEGVVLHLPAASYLQAACCYAEDQCTEWSPFVALRDANRTRGPDQRTSGRTEACPPWEIVVIALGGFALLAFVIIVGLVARVRRLRRELDKRKASSATESQPFIKEGELNSTSV